MIRNQWYAVLDSREVKQNRPIGVTRLAEKLVFWRNAQGQVFCLKDRCAHRGAALSAGIVHQGNLQCPFHGFEYDPSGACRYIPARGLTATPAKGLQVPGYPVKEAFDFIWLWWGEAQETYPEIPFFDDLHGFSYGTDHALWDVHYSRAVENQLDVFHLPFVHHNTIGRGNHLVADGPYLVSDDYSIKVWVSNRHENGKPGKLSSEMPPPKGEALLHFLFPHLWMNRLSTDFRIVIAFVPVDEHHTRFYLRYYQRFIRIPVLRELANCFTAISSRIILKQDQRVVITQQPDKSVDKAKDEVLISADRPIILYRKIRQKLIDQSKFTPEN